MSWLDVVMASTAATIDPEGWVATDVDGFGGLTHVLYAELVVGL